MKSPALPVLCSVLLLAGCLLICGCASPPDDRGEGAPTGAAPSQAIVGTWLSLPYEPEGIRELYIFKNSGRTDATLVPGTPGEALEYEVYLQGTWEQATGESYLLVGEEVTHHFKNDSHSTRAVRDLLRYDPRDQRLYRESDPSHPLERISEDPVIPAGMNVSIPWD